MSPQTPHFYEFDSFRLDPSAPLLLRESTPVDLTLKALKTLLVLVEHRGRVVSRQELIEAVWPDVEVEENNLSVNISALRKVLSAGGDGKNYIETVPRRGYRFTAAVSDVRVESVELIYTKRNSAVTLTEQPSATDVPVTQTTMSALAVAVLPFNSIGASAVDDYFGIGLCDTLITRLSRVPRFAMRPTSSVVRYGDGQ